MRISEGPLQCPKCNDDYLHQRECRAVWRLEDKDGTEYVSNIEGGGTFRRKSPTIAGRRDVIEIDFECENCSDTSTMIIMQHKGQTFIKWEEK